MGVFHFKRFDVRNERSAMKVNTDGVLLGAATDVLAGDRRVLDVGTGTGTVALMIAQRMDGSDLGLVCPGHRHRCPFIGGGGGQFQPISLEFAP